jgi:tRNA-dihydrouridine synthase
MVTKKKRGSGLLPYPETIVALLEKIVPQLTAQLSIKTRLGYHHRREIATLLPLLNDFPLKEIIIHARLGVQLYRGGVDLEGFALCRELSRHTLVYNGDITDMATFKALSQRFPWVSRWMIGRGILSDPFLLQSLRGDSCPTQDRLKRLEEFHTELYQGYSRRLSGPGHLLGRMKQLWIYLITSFPHQQKLLKKIKRAASVQQDLQAMEELFHA